MAQTKTRSKPKPKSGASSKPKKTRSASKPKATKPKASKPKATKSKSKSSSSRSSSNGASANSTSKPKAAVKAVEGTAKDAGRAVGNVAGKAGNAVGKAKVPLMAGGAALAGAAGGIALRRQGNRHRGLAAVKPKINSKDLAKAARKATDVGAQVGEIALEVRRAREESNGTHRSPVEVVLDGLTSRRPKRG